MYRTFGIKGKIVSLLVCFSLFVITASEGAASISVGNDEQQISEEQAKIIEQAVSTDLINEDVYETDNEIVADGYSSEITIPKEGDSAIKMNDGEGETLEFGLPEEVDDSDGLLTDNVTVVYNGDDDVSVGVQPLTEIFGGEQIDSVRALITIANADAPHEYAFDFNLENGDRLVSAKECLGATEVYVVGYDGSIKSVIDPAWAKDANGKPVDTHYEVDGSSLIQVVEFDENSAFPVVADPTAWQVTKCVGTILFVIGTTIFCAAKIVKLKKAIKAAGGVKKAAKALIKVIKKNKGKGKWWKKINWSKYGKNIAAFGADIIGISDIRANCTF